MRRTTFALAALVVAFGLGLAVAGCGGGEEVTPTPSTVEGTISTTPSTTTTSTTPGPKGDPVAGKAVFTGSAGCTGCHTLADAGSTGTVGPNLDTVNPKPTDALVTDRVTNGKGVMPSFKGTLTPQQIADVAAYVSSVAGQ
jgi:mono/diheme cytochrome c family protein